MMTEFSSSLRPLFEASLPCDGDNLSIKSWKGWQDSVTVTVPGSKSFTNRALVLSGLSRSTTQLSGVLFSDDSYWGLHSLQQLGFQVEVSEEENHVTITPPQRFSLPSKPLHFGMAGTLSRFFPAVLLNSPTSHHTYQCDGHKRLQERPVSDMLTALTQWGAKIHGDSLPYSIEPSQLMGTTRISGAKSGQFLSGLLICAAGASAQTRESLRIERTDNLVQPDYVRMTLQALKDFGANVTADDSLTHFEIKPGFPLSKGRYTVEADASTACYFLSIALITKSKVMVSNLGSDSLQPDAKFIGFLRDLGAKVDISSTTLSADARHLKGKKLKGNLKRSFLEYSDQALTAGTLACYCDGPIEIREVEHIRHHECDRISSICANLKALGVTVEEFPDGFKVFPPQHKLGGTWPTHNDHRFAMAGTLIALENDVIIEEARCVEKTAPRFFLQLQQMGIEFAPNPRSPLKPL